MTLTLNGSPAAITLINGWEFFCGVGYFALQGAI